MAVNYSLLHSTSWLLNSASNYHVCPIFGVSTEIVDSSSTGNTWTIRYNQIPQYDHIFTQKDIDDLNNRPHAKSDFTLGFTTAEVGKSYSFGSSIGYAFKPCELGYWPPGPKCPMAQNDSLARFPLPPLPEVSAGILNAANYNTITN